MIVDAHHHLWDTSALHYPLFDTVPALQGRYRVGEYEREARAVGIDRSVFVEASSAGASAREETVWAVEEANTSALVERLVVWAPVGSSDLVAHLDWLDLLGDRRIVGIRRSFEFEPPHFVRLPEVVDGVRLIGARGYSFDLVLFQPSLPSVVELVRACPDVQFILDHLGKPGLREGVAASWHTAIRELARFPNVVCKISGLATEADHARWTKEELRPYIEEVITAFSSNRVMFGSDWPVCNLAGGLARWLEAVEWCLVGASAREAEAFWWRTAARVYRMPQVA